MSSGGSKRLQGACGGGPAWQLLDARAAGRHGGQGGARWSVHGAMKRHKRSIGGALLSALSCLRISCFYSTSEALYAGQLLVLTAATSGC